MLNSLLQYMHERNIMHRDLKTQNIFLTKSKVIKVGDLGIARQVLAFHFTALIRILLTLHLYTSLAGVLCK